jgi:DNA-binding NarL/FixJ family response regulator
VAVIPAGILPAMVHAHTHNNPADWDMKVFVVEDSQAVRERLVEMIREVHDVEIVGEAESEEAAVSGILATRPDVAILDISLKEGSGIAVLARVKRLLPALKGIMLTNYASAQHANASAEAGADYFLDKSSEFEKIVEILERLMQGGLGTATSAE